MTGLEPLALKVAEEGAKSLAGIVVKFAWDGGGGLFKRMNLSESIQQGIFSASRKYVENYAERHGKLKVLGMREPVKLEDVYTAVQFLGEEGIKAFASIGNLEDAFRKSQTRGFQSSCEKQDGLKVANDKQYLMVLGQPGAGKSTFLRRLGLEALKGKKNGYKHECVPVFLELKRFTTGKINLEQAIIQELENCGFPKPEDSAKKLLEKGKLLILLDGLDEIPTQQLDKAITTIQDFVDKHSQNRFIASCRTAAYRSRFQRFNDVIMADFDDEQIEQFINNWFQSEQDKQVDTAKRCWELLQQPEYDATKELAQTPLLLTLLCLVFDDSQTFPKNRAVLYGEALDVLLKKWASEKRVQRDPIYKDLSLKLEEMMLAEIASHNFVENKLFFSQREVEAQISKFLANNLNAPKHLDAGVILEAIQIQQGILVERAKDVLSFSHLTLQEYLTAQYIVDNNGIEGLVKHELANRRWREVFLLVAGLMRVGTDQLLLVMEKQALSYINTPKLQALLRWAHEETIGSAGDIKPYAKRAASISIAHAHAKAIVKADTAVAKVDAKVARAKGIVKADTAIANADAAIANTHANAHAKAKAIAIANAIANAHAKADTAIAKADAAIANADAKVIAKADAVIVKANTAIANAKVANAYADAAYITNAYAKAAIASANAYAIANANAYVIANANAKVTNADAKADVANANALNAITELINYARDLENLKIFNQIDFHMLIVQMEALFALIPGDQDSREAHKSFAKRFIEIWLHAFNLTPEMANLSEQEIEALDDYLYANHLIMECSYAAVRLAPKTWEGIEERMLKID